MNGSWIPALSAACSAIVLLSCGEDPLAPESRLNGLYALATVSAQRLPIVLWSEDGKTLWLVWETVSFDGKRQVNRTFGTRLDSLDVVGVRTQTTTHQLSYRVQGDSVIIGRLEPCPPNALCVLPDLGRFFADTLLLESRLLDGRQALYQRRYEI